MIVIPTLIVIPTHARPTHMQARSRAADSANSGRRTARASEMRRVVEGACGAGVGVSGGNGTGAWRRSLSAVGAVDVRITHAPADLG
eukprot:scaffold2814_cov154-Isochrysis_galbana.AAC.4